MRTRPLNASVALAGAAPGKGTLVLEARLGGDDFAFWLCGSLCLQPDQNHT